MTRFLADENFSVPILAGLRRRLPDLDIVHIHELGMDRTPDPDILIWAAAENRVVVTHDADTMPDYAYQRLQDGLPMPGMVVWAAAENRVVITHDADTMPDYAYQRLRAGLPMPGMVVVPEVMPIGQAIERLALLIGGSFDDEWANLVRHLLPG